MAHTHARAKLRRARQEKRRLEITEAEMKTNPIAFNNYITFGGTVEDSIKTFAHLNERTRRAKRTNMKIIKAKHKEKEVIKAKNASNPSVGKLISTMGLLSALQMMSGIRHSGRGT